MFRSRNLIFVAPGLMTVWAFLQLVPSAGEDRGPASNVSIQTNSENLSLADLKGKVVVMDFWATWCGPCREAMPRLQELYTKYRSKGLTVMGIATDADDTAGAIPGVVSALGVTYPIGRPVSMQSLEPYKISAIPLVIVVDRKGNIRMRGEGLDEQTLTNTVEQCLKE